MLDFVTLNYLLKTPSMLFFAFGKQWLCLRPSVPVNSLWNCDISGLSCRASGSALFTIPDVSVFLWDLNCTVGHSSL